MPAIRTGIMSFRRIFTKYSIRYATTVWFYPPKPKHPDRTLPILYSRHWSWFLSPSFPDFYAFLFFFFSLIYCVLWNRRLLHMKKHFAPSIPGSFISYLFFILMSVFFAFFYQQTFFYMLVILELCLPAISYYLSNRCFNNLQPVLMIHPNTTQKGCTANIIVQIKNPVKLPFSSIAATISFCSFFYHDEDKKTHFIKIVILKHWKSFL